MHPLRKSDVPEARHRDMGTGQTHKVRHFNKGQRPAALDLVPIFTEDGGKLPFTVCTFAL